MLLPAALTRGLWLRIFAVSEQGAWSDFCDCER